MHLDGGAELRAVERLELLGDLGEAAASVEVKCNGCGEWIGKITKEIVKIETMRV